MTSPAPPPPDEDAERLVLIEMERDPAWAGGRFRLRRRSARPQRKAPLWVRFGLASRWPTGAVLAVTAAVAAAAACALIAAAVLLPAVWN